MRVVVTGATGNLGTSTVSALLGSERTAEVVGLARRRPQRDPVPGATWVQADVAKDDLRRCFEGADAVVHLAWLFQPTHRPTVTWENNVIGSQRVFAAAVEAGVPAVIYSSSVGAYSPGPGDRAVDESWPTDGWPGAAYTREKAYLERVLDALESRHPDTRFVRIRPGFVFKSEAATEQRRLFAGPLLPRHLLRPELLPIVPDLPGLRMQVVHSRDVGHATARAVTTPARGAFNLATDPPVDASVLARLLGARRVPLPLGPVRAAVGLAWWAHLVPATRGLLDAVLHLPVMSTERARRELGWSPTVGAEHTILEALEGMRSGAGTGTDPLAPEDSAASRAHEIATGVGTRP